MAPPKPTDEEMDEQLNRAAEAVDEGSSRWPGMSYEQGVYNALNWAMGTSDERPMEDE